MIDDSLKNDMLKSIALSGDADITTATSKPIIAKDASSILNVTSGLPKIRTDIINKFKLILKQISTLSSLSPFEIRCCLCHKVISYPCWYHEVKYAVNHFHYFICFDKDSKDKPTTKCYRRT